MKKGIILTTICCILFVSFLFVSPVLAKNIGELKKGDILRLVDFQDTGYNWFESIRIRERPTMFAPILGNIFFELWHYDETNPRILNVHLVQFLGETKNGWIKVYYPTLFVTGWVYGYEFFVTDDTEHKEFEKPLDFFVHRDEVLGRRGPAFFSEPVILYGDEWEGVLFNGYTFKKGKILKIVGRKGNWLKTGEGLWVFHELVEINQTVSIH